MSVVRRVGKKGVRFAIRYYGPDGRQRWETIGPNRKEAELVLAQRLVEVRSGKFPILRRRQRLTFAVFAEEWRVKHLPLVRASAADRYRSTLKYQLMPAFGDRLLSGITETVVQAWIADVVRAGHYAPKSVNGAIALLKQLLAAAVRWGYLPSNPIAGVRKLKIPRRNLPLWTPAELRKFLLAAPEAWRPVWIVAVFCGLRPGELQPMRWQGGKDCNWPDFTANKLHVTCAYEAKTKTLGAPKTDQSVRDVDMPPTVRAVLEAVPTRAAGGLVFPRPDGRMFSRSAMDDAWQGTLKAAGARRIRPYDLRHTFASLLIAAGKNALYIARQMGHHSAGFTFDTYGHLMDSIPRRQVEWIDEIVFPEGFAAALKLHLDGAPQGAAPCSDVQPSEGLERSPDAVSDSVVQSGAAPCVAEGGRFELPRGRPLAVFKTAAIVHSAIPPVASIASAPCGSPVAPRGLGPYDPKAQPTGHTRRSAGGRRCLCSSRWSNSRRKGRNS